MESNSYTACRPGRFDKFIRAAKDMAGELELVFGLEDTHGYGRNLAAYLTGHKYTVKSINPAYYQCDKVKCAHGIQR